MVKPPAANMWSELVSALRTRRSIWVRKIQPGLVAADPTVALLRVGMCLLAAPLFNWSCSTRNVAVVALALTVALALICFYWPRSRPVEYARWRWVLILMLNLTMALGGGNVFHCHTVPSDGLLGYLKNILLASGMVVSVWAFLLNREMFYLSCPCSMLLVACLCYRSKELCQEGLLATGYSTARTRALFLFVGKAANVIANIMRPYERDPLLAEPAQPDTSKDLPCCICLVHTLCIIFCFIIPNVVLYLYESDIIEKEMNRLAQEHQGGRQIYYPEQEGQGQGVWGKYGQSLLTGAAVTLLGGTVAWAALRSFHDV